MKTKYPHHEIRQKEAYVTTDLKVLNGGSVFLFCPGTEAATAGLAAHCPQGDEHQYVGRNLAVEARYCADLVQYARNDGLTVS
jgi:hypothetical protein